MLGHDKAYSHPSTRQHLRSLKIPHTIPERSDQIARRKSKSRNGGRPPGFDAETYKNRNTVERGFSRLKQWRGIATRYDKYAVTYLGGVTLAAAVIYHRVPSRPPGPSEQRHPGRPWRSALPATHPRNPNPRNSRTSPGLTRYPRIRVRTNQSDRVDLRRRKAQAAGHQGPGFRARVAMAFKLIESAQHRWRAVNAPNLVPLVRAGATFIKGKLVERPAEPGGDQQVA